PSPHGGTLGNSENRGRNAYDDERRATFVARFVRGTDGLFKSGSGSKAEPCARECRNFVNEIAVGTVIADRPYSTLLRATRVDIKEVLAFASTGFGFRTAPAL